MAVTLRKGNLMIRSPKFNVAVITAVFIAFFFLPLAYAEEYETMKGVDSVKVMFDMRDGVPMIAATHLQFVQATFTIN